MQYLSTRDSALRVSAQEAIVRGLAPQSGLFVPETFPQADLDAWKNLSYPELAEKVLAGFLTDYSADFLHTATASTYGAAFGGKAGETVKVRDGLYSLELWHGPTCAFKDYALQLMPKLLVEAKKMLGRTETTRILVATSGDTGKAALAGYADLDGIEIEVFYPNDGTSEIQHLQMATQKGENVQVYAVQGNFDDAQTNVKHMFNDVALREKLAAKKMQFSSANSMNIGRLVPQVVYYVYAYAQLVKTGQITAGEKVNFTVPTGNFGNILAAFYAKNMGVPVGKLICASNENKVLYDFFETGVYDKNREFILTSSPSMDILISSNLERLIFRIAGDDAKKTAEMMDALKTTGKYTITDEMKSKLADFTGGWASEEDTAKEIKRVFDETGYVMDTHTAVASSVYHTYKEKTNDDTKTIIASTASPYKFGTSVMSAIDKKYEGMDDFALIDELCKTSGVKIPNAVEEIRTAPVLHDTVCETEDMQKTVEKILGL